MNNIGSTYKFWYLPVNQVNDIPLARFGIISEPITIKSSWNTLYYSTGNFSEKSKQDNIGLQFESEFIFSIPKDNSTTIAVLSEMANNRFIVVVQDLNGIARIIGRLDNPTLFEFDRTTGENPADFNNYSCRFYLTDVEPAPIYTLMTGEAGDDENFIDFNDLLPFTEIAEISPLYQYIQSIEVKEGELYTTMKEGKNPTYIDFTINSLGELVVSTASPEIAASYDIDALGRLIYE